MNRRTVLAGSAVLLAVSTADRLATASDTKNQTAVDSAAKQLLVLMDADKSGKVSKVEFMAFMEKEFDRLDVNHDGELDVHELKEYYSRRTGGSRR